MIKPKKAIITLAGLGIDFLPLSQTTPKELWPLADKPLLHYIVKEAIESGMEELIFVVKKEHKDIVNYFKVDSKLEKILKEKKANVILEEMKNLQEMVKDVSISSIVQKKPSGDAQAVLQAVSPSEEEPVVVIFADDVVFSKKPVTLQLKEVFKTPQKPIIALSSVKDELLPFHGVVKGEKIANKYFKIKDIVEKPSISEAPSNLAVKGRYILTPDFLTTLKQGKRVFLADALKDYLKSGKVVYGYETEGNWLESNNKLDWMKSNLYTCLNHPYYGTELKKYLKKII